MKIIALQGSPRKKGNTATILGWVEDELKSMGHDVESIYLNSRNIHGCLACGKCKEKSKRRDELNGKNISDMVGCIQDDYAPVILEKMVNAQLVIFASPLYFWGFTSQIKALIDRTYSLYINYHMPDHTSLVEGQRQALLMTGGGTYDNNAEAVFTAFNRMQNPHKAINAGELFIGKCSTPEMLDSSAREQAVKFARTITA